MSGKVLRKKKFTDLVKMNKNTAKRGEKDGEGIGGGGFIVSQQVD